MFGNTQSTRGSAVVVAVSIPSTASDVTATFTGAAVGDHPYVSAPAASTTSILGCPVVAAANVIIVRVGPTFATVTETLTCSVTLFKATGEDNIPPA